MINLALGLFLLSGLPAVDEDGLAKLIEKHRGDVLIVNFWATWCGPCREEFPHLVDVSKDRRDQGLQLVTISMDEPEDVGAATEFLRQQGAESSGYIRGFEDFEAFVNAIDPLWSGALPTTFIFDREGNLAFKKVGEISREELYGEVDEVIGAGK